MRCAADKVRFIAALVITLGLFGCSTGAQPAMPAPLGTLRIVSSLPARGQASGQGLEIRRAINLALEERANSAGQWEIEHILLDSSDSETGEWSRERELDNVQQAVDDPSVIAYIGPYTSGAAMLSIPITSRAGLLQVSPSATWPGLTEEGWNAGEPDIYYQGSRRNFVAMMSSDALQADFALRWTDSYGPGPSKIAVLDDGSTYSAGLAARFERAAGPRFALRLTIDPLKLDGLVDQIEDTDTVFYAPSSVQNAISLARVLTGTNLDVIATDVALDPQFLAMVGDKASNWRIISNSLPSDQAGIDLLPPESQFLSTFQQLYGTPPGQFALHAYIATVLVLEVIAEEDGSTVDRASIIDAFMSAESLTPSVGRLFTEVGRPTRAGMTGYKVEEGRFVRSTVIHLP